MCLRLILNYFVLNIDLKSDNSSKKKIFSMFFTNNRCCLTNIFYCDLIFKNEIYINMYLYVI